MFNAILEIGYSSFLVVVLIVVAITDILMSLIHSIIAQPSKKINYLKWLYIQQLIQHNGVLKAHGKD